MTNKNMISGLVAIFALVLGLALGDEIDEGICDIPPKPPHNDLEKTARWMVHSLNWGILSTLSSREISKNGKSPAAAAVPFGNVYSFADGPCDTSSGIPYFYGTDMDQTMIDLDVNPICSLTLSEVSLENHPSISPSCKITPRGYGDPENPPCARLVLTGRFVRLTEEEHAEELEFAKQSLFERHPVMAYWPKDHNFFVGKMDIEDIWLLDYFGGPSSLNIKKYFEVELDLQSEKTEVDSDWEENLASLLEIFQWLF